MIRRPPSQRELKLGQAAGWGAPPPTKPRARLVEFRPLLKNSLRGFASVELPSGLMILDVPVLVSNGKAWAALPAKPQLDKDGHQKRDPNGKPAYGPVLRWRNRELADGFSNAVIALIRSAHPDALEGAP